jgi:hypothetical protein
MSKVVDKTPQLFEQLETELTEFTRQGAKAVLEQIKKQSEEPKSGEVYGDHQASAPGEPWATETEETIKSFTFGEVILGTTLYSTLWRAQGLEEGIKDADGEIKIEPRPSVEPAFQTVLPTLERKLQEAVNRAKRTVK